MTMLPIHALSLAGSLAAAAAVMVWRIRETRSPVTQRRIIIPPLGMATGFSMFLARGFRVPWSWAAAAFIAGFLILAYPLLRTSRLQRQGSQVMARRSAAFFSVLIVLAAIRLAARSYLDTLLTAQQTAALFFILAFGMILRWRANMLRQYQALTRNETPPASSPVAVNE